MGLIRATAWGMEIPAAYGLFHMLLLVLGIPFVFFLGIVLRKISMKKILWFCGFFLLITEVYKKLFYWVVEISVTGVYRWGIVSWQLCSIPMYLCVLIPVLKEGKVKQAFIDFLVSYNFLGGFLAFFEPSGLFHEYIAMTTHALIWHFMLVFIGVYLVASGKSSMNYKAFLYCIPCYYAMALVAIGINMWVFWYSGDICSMFFLGLKGPKVVVFQNVFESCGWIVSTIFFTVMVSVGAFLFYALGICIRKHVKNKSIAKNAM